ncbi:MAG: DUF447 domain-containing protein [Pirellulales bacterium]
MILEGIVTTLSADGAVNISPMGPKVNPAIDCLVLKPYQTSTTYQNLKRTGQGVFHVTDDVELLARAAVGTPDPLPPMEPAQAVDGRILSGACRWYAFRVRSLDDSRQRTEIVCDVVARGRQRDFFGFNRAKHAVVEAAILATRTEFLPAAEVLSEFERLKVLVDKTGGPAEGRAFEFLSDFVRARYAR